VGQLVTDLTRLIEHGRLKPHEAAMFVELGSDERLIRSIPLLGISSNDDGGVSIVGETKENFGETPRELPELHPNLAKRIFAAANALFRSDFPNACRAVEDLLSLCRQLSGRFVAESDEGWVYAWRSGEIWQFSGERWVDLLLQVSEGRGYNLGDFGEWVGRGIVDISELTPERAVKLLDDCD
jgi:hypothetical protein